MSINQIEAIIKNKLEEVAKILDIKPLIAQFQQKKLKVQKNSPCGSDFECSSSSDEQTITEYIMETTECPKDFAIFALKDAGGDVDLAIMIVK